MKLWKKDDKQNGPEAATAEALVRDVDSQSFQREVVDASFETLVVVDFWAPWCGPCRQLSPILEKLAAEGKGAWRLVKINTDENQELAMAFGIQGIPAVKAIRDGQLVDEFVGAQPEAVVRQWLGALLPAPGVAVPAGSEAAQEPAAPPPPPEDPAVRAELEDLLAAVRANAGRERDAAREAMVARLSDLGEDDPLTREYRRRLATELW